MICSNVSKTDEKESIEKMEFKILLFACIGGSWFNIYCSYDVIVGFFQSDKVFDILKGSDIVKIIIAEYFFSAFQTFPAHLKPSYF